ncbi:histidine kinase [Clostridium sp. 19966]|uniref:cache domain-containing sensor histidine kinase n=1 Tax=Clostridium sp. 19966 TaxID=2768166 RepID=UPI0028DFE892|nr:histidine kinase [Clostridium sp. 19966]MDT8715673.1 histidine kinase [Clostridium sp. 19966]
MKLLKKANCIINNMKIRKKLIGIYIIAVLPVLIVGIYLTNGMKNIVVENAVKEASVNTDRISDRFNDIVKIANYVSDRLYFNSTLSNIVLTKYKSTSQIVETYDSIDLFDQYLNFYNEIKSIRFYVDNDTMLDNSTFIRATENIKNSPWYKKAYSNNGAIIWMYKHDDIANDNYLSLIRLVKDSNNVNLGVLVININQDSIRSIINNEPYTTIISLDKSNMVMSNKSDAELIKINFEDEKYLGEKENYIKKIYYKGEKSNVILKEFQPDKALNNTFEISTVMSIDDITQKSVQIQNKGFAITGISLILSIILILVFSHIFTRRVELLRKEMHKVVSGDFNISADIGGNDEIKELYDDLYAMMRSIEQLIQEVYVVRIQKEQLVNKQKEAQFKMLSSQINPHFLYNTLETIRMKAFCNGQKEIADIVKMLGKIMRRNLEVKNKLVSLESEIELTKSYLAIQKLRFGDKVNYNIEILCSVEEYKILPLLLQPIVENAFIHGLENKEDRGTIDIVIENENGILNIDVIDNGIGISEEKLKDIKEKLSDSGSDDGESIGIRNVNQRIKIYYGESYGVSIVSKVKQGTKVRISIPVSEEGFYDIKGTYC